METTRWDRLHRPPTTPDIFVEGRDLVKPVPDKPLAASCRDALQGVLPLVPRQKELPPREDFSYPPKLKAHPALRWFSGESRRPKVDRTDAEIFGTYVFVTYFCSSYDVFYLREQRARGRAKYIDRLVKKIDTSMFPMPVRIKVDLSPWRDEVQVSIELEIIERKTMKKQSLYFPRFVDPFQSDREILKVIRQGAVQFLMHEFDECFLVDGERVFDPHDERWIPEEVRPIPTGRGAGF